MHSNDALTTPTLAESLPFVRRFALIGDHVTMTCDPCYMVRVCRYPLAELARLHPQLPVVLAAACEHRFQLTSVRNFDIALLHQQVLLLQGQLAELHLTTGLTVRVYGFDDIEVRVRDGSRYVVLETTLYQFGRTAAGVTFVAGTVNGDVALDPGWLDQSYPDWEDRFTVGVSLGYTGEELANQVLSQPRALMPAETLSGLSFD